MLETQRGEDGRAWVKGNTYPASTSFARSMVGRGFAYAPNGEVGDAQFSASEASALKASVSADGNTPVVVLGGDHPYAQWYGTNGKNGVAQLYADYGVPAYLAINTGSQAVQNPGDAGYCTWDQLKALQPNVEIVAHGARHLQAWQKLNTGLKLLYSGPAATATVYVSSTQIIGTTAGGVADFAINLAGLTLTQLCTQIAAVSGWSAVPAPELTGTELATKLLVLASAGAKNAKFPLTARIAAGGGIQVRYTGTTYRSARVQVAGTILRVYGDGVPILALDLTSASYDTLQEVVTAINGLSGWIAYLCDNHNSIDSDADNYISGAEASANLLASDEADCIMREVIIDAGLTHAYMRRRQWASCRDVAAANGIGITSFAQSGGFFYEDQLFGASTYRMHRGSPRFGYAPFAAPLADARSFVTHQAWEISGGWTSAARLTAIIDALEDSGPMIVCGLIHAITPDGTSGYPIIPDGQATQTEAAMIALLARIKAGVAAGRLRVAKLSDVPRLAGMAPKPANLIFNPLFKNSGESLVGIASVDDGKRVPGWRWQTPAHVTAATVTDGVIELTTNASTLLFPAQQAVRLEPGVTYEAGINVEAVGALSGGNGVGLRLQPLNGVMPTQTVLNDTIQSVRRLTTGASVVRFTVPGDQPTPPFVRSVAGPFNLAATANIRVNIDSKGLTADINVAGATPSATTAKEVAAAINAAIAANASYPAEYHTAAKVEGNRVVISSPWATGGDPTSNRVLVDQGSANDAFATIFGVATTNDGLGVKTGSLVPRWWMLIVSMDTTGTARVSEPWLRKVAS